VHHDDTHIPYTRSSDISIALARSIGWAHSTARFVDINSYEDGKSKRRSQSDLVLSREEREEILTMWGISFNDIVDAIRSNIKVKSQRRQTVTNLGKMQRIEEAFESATRKLKRTLLLQRRTGDKVKQLQEQADLAAAKAFSQLRFVEERTLSEIRSPKGRVETEPERDDHLEQLAVQVEVSNFCRTSPMESCLRSSVRSGGNGASMSSGNNRMGMNRSGTDSGNGSNGNANSNSQNNGNSNGKTDGNNTGSDGNSVDGRSVADRTTPSAMEMERFHRELEMEMFGEENFSLSDDLPPSMVGQTVEVGHFNDMEDDITMAADLLSAFAGTATAAAGYDGIAMEQQELENEEEQKQTSSHHAALHSNKSLDDFQSLYEDTDDFPVFFRSNIAKRNSMTSNHFPSTNDKMCVMPPSFPAHIYEAEEPIHGTSSNHDHDHYDDRQSQQPQPQQHWNVTEYAYIDEESYLPPPPPSLQKPKKKTSIILPQRYPVGEDYDPTYNSNAVTTTIDDTIIIHESFEYRSTPAGTIISEEDDTHEEEEKGSMDHRDFNGEYTAKHIDANYMPSHQHNNYTASDAHGGEGDEQWRQQQHQQTDDDDNDNNDDDNDEEDDGDNEPKIRHIPPPSYLTPSGWMEDYGGPSMRRFDPITISEDSAFMHQHQYQYQYQHQHQHHYQYQHQHHQYQHHNQQRATFPASFY